MNHRNIDHLSPPRNQNSMNRPPISGAKSEFALQPVKINPALDSSATFELPAIAGEMVAATEASLEEENYDNRYLRQIAAQEASRHRSSLDYS